MRLSPSILLASAIVAIAGSAGAVPVQWRIEDGGNNHYYDYVSGNCLWSDAKTAAEASVYQGRHGYLATITSDAEKEFVRTSVPMTSYRAWLGGYQDTLAPDYQEPGGGWRWITGEPWSYTHWAYPEPNDLVPNENYLEVDIVASSPDHFGWADQENYELTNKGYYVEYGSSVPEPSSLVLVGLAAAGLLLAICRLRAG